MLIAAAAVVISGALSSAINITAAAAAAKEVAQAGPAANVAAAATARGTATVAEPPSPPSYCDPTSKPPQLCPGGRPCPACGTTQCLCPPPGPPPAPPLTQYICDGITHRCSVGTSGGHVFSNLSLCQIECEPQIRFSCDNESYKCVEGRLGNFSNLTSCQAACVVPRHYAYDSWSADIKAGTCRNTVLLAAGGPAMTCTLQADGIKAYRFPKGVFEIGEQLLVPENTSITGAAGPNDMSNPTAPPVWGDMTVFLATRGATNFSMNYCNAKNMVTTRVGFVLSSHVTVRNISYQGIDTIRPDQNGALCGGGAFETKGCAENDCSVSSVNNGGSDGLGSIGVTIENVRLNDYYHIEDRPKIGPGKVAGNYDCNISSSPPHCCFCKPNGIRSTQVGVWVPQTRNARGTRQLLVKNLVSSATQADGINLHGFVRDALVQDTYIQNTGDDTYALWGANLMPENVTFRRNVAVNTGILRPHWYGNCFATYGLKSVTIQDMTCRNPALVTRQARNGGNLGLNDVTFFIFNVGFGAVYSADNNVTIDGWTFTDMDGKPYTASQGAKWQGKAVAGKMIWTDGKPYVLAGTKQHLNIHFLKGAAGDG